MDEKLSRMLIPKTYNKLDPQNSSMVPWMRAWMKSRSESKRNAFVDKVASVSGR